MNDGNPYYGGGGGGGGGGYMSGSPYGGSQESPGGKKAGGRGNQTLRPVTIKQIIDASQTHPDADFQIDGVDVNHVSFVGSVRNHTTSATNVSYEVGDGTGYIDVRQWLDSADDEAGKTDGIQQDRYVSIIGTIKVFGGKRHISAQHIHPVVNHDEIAHHLLKALQVSLAYRGGSSSGGAGAVSAAKANDYAAGGATTAGVSSSDYAHLPQLQRAVMEVVAAEDHEDGIHISNVSRLVGTATVDEVMEAIEKLMGEGLLFSTIDDLHIKAA